MNATMRTLVWGTLPIGALIGGTLGNAIGVVPTILFAGVLQMSATAWLTGPILALRSADSQAPA